MRKPNTPSSCRPARVRAALRAFLAGLLIGHVAGANAALSIPDTPLFLANDVPANIFFALDDSGSMDWEITLSNGALEVHPWNPNSGNLDMSPNDWVEDLEMCAGYNVLAYDPNVTYTPWLGEDEDGVPFGNQSINAVRWNPYDPDEGTVNLLAVDGTGRPAVYGVWVDGAGGNPVDGRYQWGECPPHAPNDGSYLWRHDNAWPNDARWVFVDDLSPAEQTNYANWYAYYRKREHVLKRAISELITNSNQRMGLATLHNNNAVGTAVSNMTDAAAKENLLDELFQINSVGGTPLRLLLRNVGRYFDQNDAGNYLHSNLGFSDDSPILPASDGGECQQNFTVLFSDGFWNGGSPSVGNDDADGPGPWDGGPHADNFSDTLADVAMQYYERDLSSLPNNVPVMTNIDENDAQHMVTYAVSFGLDGTLTEAPPNHDPATPPPPWPQPFADQITTTDDMRHAAFNSRGRYLAGQDPQGLIQTLNDALNDIGDRTGSASAVAATSQSIQTGTLIFQGFFDTDNWDGELFAYEFLDGGVIGSTMWAASENIPLENARDIFTWVDDGTVEGAEFEWANLTAAQQGAIGSQTVLEYVRGVRTGEVANGGTLRNRDSLLGDIIHSTPVAVTKQQTTPPYQLLPGTEGTSFNAYLATKQSRIDMVYVGANDGMMHGIRTDTGAEEFAYVPRGLFGKLAELTSPSYDHEFYVDGALQAADAYVSSTWRAVLVGALGRGGKALFALDVSDPTGFAASDVLWEYTHAELGHVLGKAQVARLNNGSWAVITGNGYNSTSERAQLFVIDLATGNVIRRFDTGLGSGASPNGLGTPLVVDVNADFSYDYVYAGDLRGRLWKFDLTDPDPANWSIAFSGSPLYAAKSPTGAEQPITAKPAIIVHPDGGYILLFGTGRFFVSGDDLVGSPAPVDTFYGIRDNGVPVASVGTRALPGGSPQPATVLQPQAIIEEDIDDFDGTDQFTRTLTQNLVDYTTQHGWYLDLVSPVNGAQGERVIADPAITITENNDPLVIFNTYAPAGGCESAGGFSSLMAFDPVNGARTNFAVFDLNGDNAFSANDAQSDGSGGYTHDNGWIGEPTVAPVTLISSQDGTINHAVTAGLDGSTEVNDIAGAAQTLGRQSWRQLR
ncbi:MAG: PilC/PilY family type IV pilus protein [Gammaproteobacteria bacterium]